MATKKDLLEAQNFSRARLLSAFMGGAPGGKELEPAKPLRAVFAGIALTGMVLLAGIFIGLMQPALPGGWENNRLIVARDTGARYVSVDGTLHPVINTVSARMLIPAEEFEVVSVDQSALDGVPIGGTIGILGAPDTLPRADDLDGAAWRACAAGAATDVQLGGAARAAAPADGGIVVERDGETFVIADGRSHAVPEQHRTAVLRAVGLDAVAPVAVRGEWLALFARGADLAPIEAVGGGEISELELPAGSVIRPVGGGDAERYLLTPDGALAPLSGLAHRLYLLGGGSGALGEEIELSPAEIAELPTTDPAGASDWPRGPLAPLSGLEVPCAVLEGERGDQRTVLAATGGERPTSASAGAVRIAVAENGGALVRGGTAGTLTLVDGSGTAYAVPGGVREGTARLGYTGSDVAVVPAPWLQLLPAGPALTAEAAGATPEGV
ncbi:type VII secretion protein EccB [Leucobacter triazinivorans]|uniref:type VII secretion protein EccB n=1 Tax=Leucobacter triazinivorans TaxID=1784719 RepID=UPI0013EE74CA|nr:type VII secretion protein EccB [Leucobacter triazinivorans]